MKINCKTRYGHLQLGYGCNEGSEAAAHAVRNLVSTDLPEVFVMKFLLKSKFQTFSQLCASSGFLQ